MEKIKLEILGISSGHTATSYTLILDEVGGTRKLPIIIGTFEAQAIAIEIEGIVPVRPMTHDLFLKMAKAFDLSISEILIHKLQDGVFYSHIVVTNGIDRESLDARTSDAIALALRFKAPIYTYSAIMDEAGMSLSESDDEESKADSDLEKGDIQSIEKAIKSDTKDDLSKYSTEELEGMLEEAIEIENYVAAAQIRDELARRT